MDPLMSGLAEDLIAWVDDRFGRTAAWLASIIAVLALTVGTIAIGIAVLGYLGG